MKNSLEKAREFTVKTLCYIYKCDNFVEVEKTLKALLIVLLSKNIDHSEKTNKKYNSQKSLDKVDKRIRGETFEEPQQNKARSEDDTEYKNEDDSEEQDDDSKVQDEENSEVFDEEGSEIEYKQMSKDDKISENDVEEGGDPTSETFKTWAEKIYEKAKNKASCSTEGSIANAYFNEAAAKKIKDLMSHLPIWTAIMRSTFKRGGEIATSAPVESEFSSLKNTAFPQLLRVDKFILSHIEYLYGKVRLVAADAQKLEEKSIKREKLQKVSSRSAKNKVRILPFNSTDQTSTKTEHQGSPNHTKSILTNEIEEDLIDDLYNIVDLFSAPNERSDGDIYVQKFAKQEFDIQNSNYIVRTLTPLEDSITQNDSSFLSQKN